MPRFLPTSLTGRLIATLVLLVIVTSALLAVGTSLAMRSLLYSQTDDQVHKALERTVGRFNAGSSLPPYLGGHGNPGRRLGPGDAVGTLSAQLAPVSAGVVVASGSTRPLSTTALNRLSDVPADGKIHDVTLPRVGPFRVEVRGDDSARVVAGISTHNVDSAIAQLILYEVLLALVAVGLAAFTGRWLVRRQLRPLRDVAATAHEVTALPLSSGEIGTTVRVSAALTDERTEVGSVGAALNTMLEHVERALDERHRSELQVRQFVADASHELRTPLTTIHGYAELSRRTQPVDPEELSHAMSKVEVEATRMSTLVEDLLLLARLDAGRPLDRDDVDVTRLVLETVGDARVVGPDHRWLLDLANEPVTVPGDEQRLHQVLTNLLNNVRRHTPPGTVVRAGVHQDGSGVLLTVEDNGPGMPPELVNVAFQRFTRGDSSRTRESGGAGLGLSLVQAICSAHGGTVSVTSVPGRTRFEVRLPTTDAVTSVTRVPGR